MIALQSGDMATCESMLQSVQTIKDHDKIPLVKRALSSMQLSKTLGAVVDEFKDAKDVEAGSPEARFRDAVLECRKGNVEKAIADLLAIVKTHSGAKDLLLKIFAALGGTHPLTIAGRKKLSLALF